MDMTTDSVKGEKVAEKATPVVKKDEYAVVRQVYKNAEELGLRPDEVGPLQKIIGCINTGGNITDDQKDILGDIEGKYGSDCAALAVLKKNDEDKANAQGAKDREKEAASRKAYQDSLPSRG